MVYTLNKLDIAANFINDEIIEFTILEMHNSEFLIHVETPDGKKISILADNWEDIANEF